jgi:hypothetical protein
MASLCTHPPDEEEPKRLPEPGRGYGELQDNMGKVSAWQNGEKGRSREEKKRIAPTSRKRIDLKQHTLSGSPGKAPRRAEEPRDPRNL